MKLTPRATIVGFTRFWGARWESGVYVRGGTEAELAELVANHPLFRPYGAVWFDPDQGLQL